MRPDFKTHHSDVYLYLLHGSGTITLPESVPEYATAFVLSFIFLIVSNVFVAVVAAAQSEADPQTKVFKARSECSLLLSRHALVSHLKGGARAWWRACGLWSPALLCS